VSPSHFSKTIRKKTLAEQVADTIQTAIVAGDWQEGDALPTEPELCEQFGVSRAVIRDATRLLIALGLVEVRQGSGAFVTPARNAAFGDALVLALQRTGATAWDAEEFEQLLLPAAIALAAVKATNEDIAAIRQALGAYLDFHADHANRWGTAPTDAAPAGETARLGELYVTLIDTLLAATHNQVLMLLARPLARLHGLRHWEIPDQTVAEVVRMEQQVFTRIVDAVAAHDADAARAAVVAIQQLPDAAITAMQATAIGQVVEITIQPDE
jgi:GntR family transcriptional repressor for pyruvate dehydrogenase complex